MSDNIQNATQLLQHIETATSQTGLCINESKMEYIMYNQQGVIKTVKQCEIKLAKDFQYLGSWIASTKCSVPIRTAKA